MGGVAKAIGGGSKPAAAAPAPVTTPVQPATPAMPSTGAQPVAKGGLGQDANRVAGETLGDTEQYSVRKKLLGA